MGWTDKLYETFENNYVEPIPFENNFVCPIAHAKKAIQIEVTLDVKGEFHGARTLDEKSSKTLVPTNEKAVSRSGTTIAPYPLSDTLAFLAGDLGEYIDNPKDQKTYSDKFEAYMEGLKNWRDSKHSNTKIHSIYSYLLKKKLAKDLIEAGIIELNSNRLLSTKKIGKEEYAKCFVRFKVLGTNPSNCWEDYKLVRAYQSYYMEVLNKTNNINICYVSGKKDLMATNHPKIEGNAKLISSNDDKNFTYRGRFENGDEACSLGYEASQKIHNALLWLISKAGYSVDNRTYLCWSPKEDFKFTVGDVWERFIDDEDEEKIIPYKDKLKKFITSFNGNFSKNDTICLIALEAATSGRLSIAYYNELNPDDFFQRIEKWYSTCYWKVGPKTRSISVSEIIRAAYGNEQEDTKVKKLKLTVQDKLLIMQYHRLYKCIVDKQFIPRDFVEAVFRNATGAKKYSKENRELILSVGCALIRKYFIEQKGETIDMALDKNIEDRDYLYGRLLAVYEQVERSTYNKDTDREPNAIRLQATFTQRPASTRLIIENALIPYFQQLKPDRRIHFRKEIEEISNKIGLDTSNNALGYKCLIGYWAEREYLFKSKKEREEKEAVTEE